MAIAAWERMQTDLLTQLANCPRARADVTTALAARVPVSISIIIC